MFTDRVSLTEMVTPTVAVWELSVFTGGPTFCGSRAARTNEKSAYLICRLDMQLGEEYVPPQRRVNCRDQVGAGGMVTDT